MISSTVIRMLGPAAMLKNIITETMCAIRAEALTLIGGLGA